MLTILGLVLRLVVAGFSGKYAGLVMEQEEKSVRNIIVGILGGIIGEECYINLIYRIFSRTIPGLIDNLIVMFACGFLLSMLVCRIFRKKPKLEQ